MFVSTFLHLHLSHSMSCTLPFRCEVTLSVSHKIICSLQNYSLVANKPIKCRRTLSGTCFVHLLCFTATDKHHHLLLKNFRCTPLCKIFVLKGSTNPTWQTCFSLLTLPPTTFLSHLFNRHPSLTD